MDAFTLVLFGATGDLAKLKIFPALLHLRRKNLIPEHFYVIGNGRTDYNDESFRDYLFTLFSQQLGDSLDTAFVNDFLQHVYFLQGDLQDETMYQRLNHKISEINSTVHTLHHLIYHLAVLPQFYEEVVQHIQVNKPTIDPTSTRILIEKPFGLDLPSAQRLDQKLLTHFKEEQIFRIDHYLAKENMQNILVFRFANEIFEPLLNHNYVDHIQVSVLEEFGIKDRGKFYERTGALKDVVQNHLLQMLAATTMDRPANLDADHIRHERQKVLNSLRFYSKDEVSSYAVKGQYQGYTNEPFVEPNSVTDTYVAVKAFIQNQRWEGVPIYMRTGKMVSRTVSEISVIFKDPRYKPSANVLTFRISPHEGIALRFHAKKPGPYNELQQANLAFDYSRSKDELLEAYQRVLLDALNGDQTLFTKSDDVEAEWKFVDPIMSYWETEQIKPELYEPGSWGPHKADVLIQKDDRDWIVPSIDV